MARSAAHLTAIYELLAKSADDQTVSHADSKACLDAINIAFRRVVQDLNPGEFLQHYALPALQREDFAKAILDSAVKQLGNAPSTLSYFRGILHATAHMCNTLEISSVSASMSNVSISPAPPPTRSLWCESTPGTSVAQPGTHTQPGLSTSAQTGGVWETASKRKRVHEPTTEATIKHGFTHAVAKRLGHTKAYNYTFCDREGPSPCPICARAHRVLPVTECNTSCAQVHANGHWKHWTKKSNVLMSRSLGASLHKRLSETECNTFQVRHFNEGVLPTNLVGKFKKAKQSSKMPHTQPPAVVVSPPQSGSTPTQSRGASAQSAIGGGR